MPGTQVRGNQIKDGAIGTSKLADGAVTAIKIATGAVTTAKIASGAVTSTQIASGAVGTTQLAANAVATGNVQDGAITNSKLAADSVDAAKIAAGAVGNSELATDAVKAPNVVAASDAQGVPASKIKNDTALGTGVDMGAAFDDLAGVGRTSESVFGNASAIAGKVSKSGDTMSGTLDMNGNTISNVATPVASGDAPNKAYVDSVAGLALSWRPPVQLVDDTRDTLPTGAHSVDGVAVSGGDRVLFTALTTGANQVYLFDGANYTLETDGQNGDGSPAEGDTLSVEKGSTYANKVLRYDAGSPSTGWFEINAIPNAHAIGGATHQSSTLAQLNSLISDATLDDSAQPRTPTAHQATHIAGQPDAIIGKLTSPQDADQLKFATLFPLVAVDPTPGQFFKEQGGSIAASDVDQLQATPVAPGAPALNDVLTFNGVAWAGAPPTPVTQFIDNERFYGDGVTTIFNLTQTPNPTASLQVFVNGILLEESEDFTLTGNQIDFATGNTPYGTPVGDGTPAGSDKIACFYRY